MPIAEVQAGSGGGEFRATQLMKNRSGFVWTIREVSFYLSRTHARLSNPESTGPVQALVLKGFLGTRGKRVIGGRSAYRQIRSTLTDEFHRLRTLYDAPAIRNLRGPQGDHSPDPHGDVAGSETFKPAFRRRRKTPLLSKRSVCRYQEPFWWPGISVVVC